MPAEQEHYQKIIETILSTVIFENWVRFYFLSDGTKTNEAGEQEETLYIAIPEKAIQKITELYPTMLPMAERLNGREATPELSKSVVCDMVRMKLTDMGVEHTAIAPYLDTRAFQSGLYLFNTWLQAYEPKLERSFYDYGYWLVDFQTWRESEAAKEIEKNLYAQH